MIETGRQLPNISPPKSNLPPRVVRGIYGDDNIRESLSLSFWKIYTVRFPFRAATTEKKSLQSKSTVDFEGVQVGSMKEVDFLTPSFQ